MRSAPRNRTPEPTNPSRRSSASPDGADTAADDAARVVGHRGSREGARVGAIDIDPAEAERTAAEITGAGGMGLALSADVTEEDQVEAAISTVEQRLGVPAVLHNNVGAARSGDLAAWHTALDINVTSVFLTCKHVLPRMVAVGAGSVMNVSSLAALRDTGYVYPAYSAAKAAVNQLTVSLALRYASSGVRVNAVVPGLMDTPLVARQVVADADDPRAALDRRDAASPTVRVGSLWDVASAALFLASDEAAYINGVCLPVDGGLSMRCG